MEYGPVVVGIGVASPAGGTADSRREIRDISERNDATDAADSAGERAVAPIVKEGYASFSGSFLRCMFNTNVILFGEES
jgi:hypothetical protein